MLADAASDAAAADSDAAAAAASAAAAAASAASIVIPLPVASGGTGSTTAATARAALGITGSPANTIKGNNTGVAVEPPSNLTAAQVAAMLPAFTGDSGAGGVKGSVPAPAAGDAAADKFLAASGSWAVPTVPDELPSIVGQADLFLKVKNDESGVEWASSSASYSSILAYAGKVTFYEPGQYSVIIPGNVSNLLLKVRGAKGAANSNTTGGSGFYAGGAGGSGSVSPGGGGGAGTGIFRTSTSNANALVVAGGNDGSGAAYGGGGNTAGDTSAGAQGGAGGNGGVGGAGGTGGTNGAAGTTTSGGAGGNGGTDGGDGGGGGYGGGGGGSSTPGGGGGGGGKVIGGATNVVDEQGDSTKGGYTEAAVSVSGSHFNPGDTFIIDVGSRGGAAGAAGNGWASIEIVNP